jgi:4'-phosphopantetheinyl transferase
VKASARCWPSADEVHIWQTELDLGRHELGDLYAYLSTEERGRADRYRHDRDRVRCIAARGWLRYLLGSYVGGNPRALVFVQDENGKPRLGGVTGDWLRFNVSHSEGTAVYAVACGREVGVDVERVRDDVPVEVVRRFFSETEQDALAALPAGLQLRGFFECWTRKEAYLKALGVGLSGLARSDADAANWSLHSVDAGPGFAAALAVAGSADVPLAAKPLHLNTGSGVTTGFGPPL